MEPALRWTFGQANSLHIKMLNKIPEQTTNDTFSLLHRRIYSKNFKQNIGYWATEIKLANLEKQTEFLLALIKEKFMQGS